MTRRSRLLRIGLLAATAAALAATAAASAGGAGTTASNRVAAIRDARGLLARLRLPAGARALSREPSGDGGVLARPGVGPAATPVVVDKHAFWRVPLSPDQVLAYVEANPPRGGAQTLRGGGFVNGAVSFRYDGFSWATVAGVLAQRWLIVDVARLPDGSTALRADAQVVWIVARSPREKVPAGPREIDIASGVPGHAPTHALRVTSADQVRAIVAMIDRLPVSQPGVVACPAERGGAPVVTFTFRRAATDPPLAVASEHTNVTEPTTACDPLSFSIGGRAQTPLLGGAAFLHAVERLVGVTF